MSNEKLAEALGFLDRVHRGLISGRISEWPGLREACGVVYAAHAAEATQPQPAEPVASVRQALTGGYWIDWHGKQMPDYLGCDLYIHPPHRRTPMADTVKLQTDPDVIQLVQDRLDAARYRWLLENSHMFSSPECDGLQLPITFCSPNDFDLTQAIDDAMAKESGNG